MFASVDEVKQKLGITDETKVLDIGGTAQPFPYGKRTLVDLHRPNNYEGDFVSLDIGNKALPFDTKQFDVCICSHVAEDLHDPTILLTEIQRVAKTGYLEVPHRGRELQFNLEGRGEFPGYEHHHWMFETDGKNLKAIPKSWYLLRHELPKVRRWIGPPFIGVYWQDWFSVDFVREENMSSPTNLYTDHYSFIARNMDNLTL